MKITKCCILLLALCAASLNSAGASSLLDSSDLTAYNQIAPEVQGGTAQDGTPTGNYSVFVDVREGESSGSARVDMNGTCLVTNNLSVRMIYGQTTRTTILSLNGLGSEHKVYWGSPINPIYYNYYVDGAISNKCSTPITGWVHFWLYHEDNSNTYSVAHSSAIVTFPAIKTCSASVSDVDLGTLNPGDQSITSQIAITKSGDGIGTITFTGSDLNSDGDLMLGGSSTITVRPTDGSFIDSATGHWVSGPAENTIPISATVAKGTAGGTYTSNLTATLTCE